MQQLNFPANPNVGDIYQRWAWDGTKWVCAPSGGPALSAVFIGPNPPANPEPGWLWFAPDIGRMFCWYDDGTSMQWVDTSRGGFAGSIGVAMGDAAPSDPVMGQLWIQDDQVYIYEDLGWVPFVQMTRWTLRKAPPEIVSDGLNGVGYGNGLFVAVAASGSHRVATSPDAINWTAQIAVAQAPWAKVVYGNGIWVAVATGTGVNQVMTSPDGINWTLQTAAANIGWVRVRFVNGLFIAISTGGVATQRVMTSPDGINWTLRTNPAGFWNDVAYGNGVFVAVGSAGVMTSPDAVTWTQVSGASGARGIAFGNGIFLACGDSLQTSPDGINWGNVQMLPYGFYSNSWSAVAYGAGIFAVMSVSSPNATFQRVAVTRDSGVTWKLRLAPTDVWFIDVCYGNGLWVAVTNAGYGMYIMTSLSP